MLSFNNYIVAESLVQAYDLNQKKSNMVLGGTGWLRLGERNLQNVIDLSALGLDRVEESEHEFRIGSMVTLRELETNEALNNMMDSAIKKALKDIVGVQFRNRATLGGSLYSRFGFSDVLTCLMAFETYVELFKGGVVSLEEFASMEYDRDIITGVVIKKKQYNASYTSFRNQATDLPVLNCAIAVETGKVPKIVIGGRPNKAVVVEDTNNLLSDYTDKGIDKFAEFVQENVQFGSNRRGSAEYRKQLAGILVKRGLKELLACKRQEVQDNGN